MVSFTITPLTDHTGAEVIGLDFTQPIDIETRATLNRAFAERHVLVMRNQHFTPEQFKAAAQLFGELHPHDKKERHVAGHPNVEYISNDEIMDGKHIIPGETFHTDHSITRARRRPRRCSQSNCPRVAATPNTSICTMPMTIFPTPPSEKSMG
jgi:alpha-ketoglutarate-dependent taurine dioxygenase